MRKNPLWTVAAVALASFAGCGSENGEPEGGGGSEKVDVSFIPEDCFLAVVIHPKRLAESPLAKEISEVVTDEMYEEMAKEMGVDPRKMEEFVFLAIPREPTGEKYEAPFDVGFIVRFAEPIANRELLKKMFRYIDFDDEPAEHEGKEYYRGYRRRFSPRGEEEPIDRDRPADLAVCLLDERTMLFSERSEAALKKMLSAGAVKSGLVERLRKLDTGSDLIVVVVTTAAAGKSIGMLTEALDRELSLETKGLSKVSDLARAATLKADLRGDPVAELILEANDASSAAELKELADSLLVVGKAMLSDSREGILRNAPPEAGQPMIELIEGALDAVTVVQNGDQVTATLKRPEALAKLPKIVTAIVRENAVGRGVRSGGAEKTAQKEGYEPERKTFESPDKTSDKTMSKTPAEMPSVKTPQSPPVKILPAPRILEPRIPKEPAKTAENVQVMNPGKRLARVQIDILEKALQIWELDLGSYPETLEWLWQQQPPKDLPDAQRWTGPYLERAPGPDPWGNDYRYKNPGEHNPDSVDVFSIGPDGQEGTEDDIGNWQ